MKNSIPATKSKSKIKPLEEKIQHLEMEKESLLEEMYKTGIRIRPSIMTQIEEKEVGTLQTIKFYIDICEKETGRPFPHSINSTRFLEKKLCHAINYGMGKERLKKCSTEFDK